MDDINKRPPGEGQFNLIYPHLDKHTLKHKHALKPEGDRIM